MLVLCCIDAECENPSAEIHPRKSNLIYPDLISSTQI